MPMLTLRVAGEAGSGLNLNWASEAQKGRIQERTQCSPPN